MENNKLKNDDEKAIELCVDCQELVGKQRHTAPHKNLIKTDYKEVPSMFGNVDEHYYKCIVCSKTWMRETGSYGEGWL